MQVEAGQLRVWGDEITLDKTPFLVVGPVDLGGVEQAALAAMVAWDLWQVVWLGKVSTWSKQRLEMFSEVVGEG